MTFESEVMRAIAGEFPGLFKKLHDAQYATTSTGQRCAVFINQGLTYTDVILYYWDSDHNLQKYVETFLFVVAAIKFAADLVELIPQERYVEAAWEAAKLVMKGVKVFGKKEQVNHNVIYN
ncbi:hypothetical protein WR25_01788 [Diploscapter pachys]|uniref:Uncharacterized protein n=1 Tax=Diploscapter pachys TaxID=2018661 RepID=A0A2A2LTL8_9BILA|nr:hypothetical protein WR25_01788 [Diploscapter pachys]